MSHEDRRGGQAERAHLALEDGALTVRDAAGSVRHSLPLSRIRTIRLSVEPAGQGRQVVCRVSDGAQTVCFGSQRWLGPGRWKMNAVTFQTLLAELHTGLRPYRDAVDFLEGPSRRTLGALCLTGLAVFALSLASFVQLFILQENRYGLALLPGVLIGLWMVRTFWPKRPVPYDPERYATPPDRPDPTGEAG